MREILGCNGQINTFCFHHTTSVFSPQGTTKETWDKKSYELDPMPTKLVKICLDERLPAITDIINKSLQSGEFPSSMKNSMIKPLLKKPNLDHELKNYRPVSNLTYVSKLIEKAVNQQLVDYININDLGEVLQSSYKKHNSTETALTKIHNDIVSDLGSQNLVLLILLDLSAAFDTVDHRILLDRLNSRCGIKEVPLEWIESYLSNRKQAVIINGTTSKFQETKYGVPQGSVLGPTLFNIYTSPLGDIIRKHNVELHFYADDSTLYIRIVPKQENCNNAIDVIYACLADVKEWMRVNFLKLNDSKTEVMVIGLPKQLPKVSVPYITIGNNNIPPVDNVRLLGAQLDKNMSMNVQVSKLCQSLGYFLYNLSKIRKYLTTDACKTLVQALFTSRLDLNNILLTGVPQTLIKRLQLLQNTAARIIMKKPKSCHITPLLKHLHWLPVSYRIKYKLGVNVFKCLHGLAPRYLCELIKVRNCVRSLRSSALTTLDVPRTKIKFGDRAFSVAGPIFWNSLPGELRKIASLEHFKMHLKTHLFKLYFN